MAWVPKGNEQISATTTGAKSLTPASGASYALIQCLSANARWSDTTTPTTGVGMRLSPGDDLWYGGSLGDFSVIGESTATAAEINVQYYG